MNKLSVFITALLFSMLPNHLLAQHDDDILNNVYEDFQIIEAQNRFIDQLSFVTGENSAYNLPVGVKKIVGNIAFTIAVSNVKFGHTHGEVTLFVRMNIPQKPKSLIFGATDIKITRSGDLVGDVKLSLLSDVPINVGNMGDVILKGGFKDGIGLSKTYLSLDCNGNFLELSIDAEVILNKNTFSSKSAPDSLVRSSFRTVIHDWNDLIVELSIPAFEIKGANDFEFNIHGATLDLSDSKNPQNFNPLPEYSDKYLVFPDRSLWRGIYIDSFSVSLPEQFKNKNSAERIKLEANRLIIDENGVTGMLGGENILSINDGDASGWPFSVTGFQLAFIANNIKGFGFQGEIDIPIANNNQKRPYEAFISNNEYLFKVGLGEHLNFSMFKDAEINLDPSSYLQMRVAEKRFKPQLVLNGSMQLDIDGLKMEQLIFTKLAIATEAPVLSVESIEYGGEVKFNNFPVSISDVRLHIANDLASLGFSLQVNLMKGKISAGTRLQLTAGYKENKWKYAGLDIQALKLDDVEMPGFSLSGEVRWEKNNPTYGSYFGGDISATVNALSDGLTFKATALFGCKDYRYWYFEGGVILPVGIPIGPVSINGFTGGAYYKMSPTGGDGLDAYKPDDRVSLGLKSGVNYYVGSKNAVNGDALFEINFLAKGGIKNVKFYGTANFMSSLSGSSDKLGQLGKMYKQAQGKLSDASSSFADNLKGNVSGADIAKNILPDIKLGMGINAFLSMDFDFVEKIFDAQFRVSVSTPGNFIRGTGNNNEAGWAHLYCSPQSWFIHVGTPTNPVGIAIGLGPISLSSKSYFMLGDKLEQAQAPPQPVMDILRITPKEADYLKYPASMKMGKGIAFGSSFSFDTGELTFLILYARFMAGMGFDIMLSDMSHMVCEGKDSSPGIDGWYANGQVYAYLSGELGVKIKLFFIKKKIAIIKGSTAALLQARLPNPTWVGGRMAIDLNVLGGLIKARMSMKFSFGDDCKLVSKDGEYSPLDFPIISDLTPVEKESDVDVFVSPQATFNLKIGETFDAEDDNGNVKIYRISLEDMYITDSKNQKIQGSIKWNKNNDAASFYSKEILPPYSNLAVHVSVNFEENVNGQWKTVTQGGKPARETRKTNFKTGGAPNYIPLTNIEYCYPVIEQNNFFQGETATGYIQLKKGQSYLFPDNFEYSAVFAANQGQAVKSAFKYSSATNRIEYIFPDMSNKTMYDLAFVAQSITGVSLAPKAKTQTTLIKDEDGEEISVDYTQQAANKIIQDGSLKVLNYTFRSSEFNTFEQKMTALDLEPGSRKVDSETRSLLLASRANYELFDEIELVGSSYSGGVPLVLPEAILTDPYYVTDIAPLVYNWQPMSGISLTNNTGYGVPPKKAFPLYNGYLSYINSNVYNDFMAKILPYVHQLPYYYSLHYYELKNKAVNSFDRGINMRPIMPLINSHFLFIRQGDYKTIFRYTLPGNKKGTYKELNYRNDIDWRK